MMSSTEPTTDLEDATRELLMGFNVRWRDTPPLEAKLYTLINGLKPDLLRYPGGTVTHKWNWQTGLPSPSNNSDYVHKISDLKVLTDNTNTMIIFVVDVVHGTIEDQIKMMKDAKVPVLFIEMGNELYADEYEAIFPNGMAYADTVNKWIPQLRDAFPNAKIGAVLLGRSAGNDRKNQWNEEVVRHIDPSLDAFIYHIYVNSTESVENRIERFEEVFIEGTEKALWVTEYGAKSQSLDQALAIADYVESIADIALNHCLISKNGNFSKFNEELKYTEEGLAFVNRVSPSK